MSKYSPDTLAVFAPPLNLEKAVHELEERFISSALAMTDGSVYEASRILGLRNEDALEFILRRHPELNVRAPERNDFINTRVVRLKDWPKRS